MSTKGTILVAEDNAVIALLMQSDLEGAGYAVLGPFARVAPALAAAEGTRPDLALIDVDLAGGDSGADLARDLAARMDVACLFVTGQSYDAAKASAHALGALGKPVPSNDLLAGVEAALAVAKGGAAPPNDGGVAWF